MATDHQQASHAGSPAGLDALPPELTTRILQHIPADQRRGFDRTSHNFHYDAHSDHTDLNLRTSDVGLSYESAHTPPQVTNPKLRHGWAQALAACSIPAGDTELDRASWAEAFHNHGTKYVPEALKPCFIVFTQLRKINRIQLEVDITDLAGMNRLFDYVRCLTAWALGWNARVEEIGRKDPKIFGDKLGPNDFKIFSDKIKRIDLVLAQSPLRGLSKPISFAPEKGQNPIRCLLDRLALLRPPASDPLQELHLHCTLTCATARRDHQARAESQVRPWFEHLAKCDVGQRSHLTVIFPADSPVSWLTPIEYQLLKHDMHWLSIELRGTTLTRPVPGRRQPAANLTALHALFFTRTPHPIPIIRLIDLHLWPDGHDWPIAAEVQLLQSARYESIGWQRLVYRGRPWPVLVAQAFIDKVEEICGRGVRIFHEVIAHRQTANGDQPLTVYHLPGLPTEARHHGALVQPDAYHRDERLRHLRYLEQTHVDSLHRDDKLRPAPHHPTHAELLRAVRTQMQTAGQHDLHDRIGLVPLGRARH